MRKSFVPLRSRDKLLSGIAILLMPIYYYFNIYVVLPDIYETGSKYYLINFISAHFIAFNIIGNYFCMMICDTSLKEMIINENIKTNIRNKDSSITRESIRLNEKNSSKLTNNIRYCIHCDNFIIKRDHHCLFIGYCIGKYNRRFFIILLIYIVFFSSNNIYLITMFMKKRMNISLLKIIIQIFFPPSIIIFSNTSTLLDTIYLILYLVFILLSLMSLILCTSNTFFIAKELIRNDIKVSPKNYDNHKYYHIVDNIEQIFGSRWYLTWISPLISSDIPIEY